MRKPPKYVVIGNGRMATHMCYYLHGLSIQYQNWCREDGLSRLGVLLSDATHILVLITDNQIDSFIRHAIIPSHNHLTIVHFSGCLQSELAYSAHPLQTFARKQPYPSEEYQRIPFILEKASLPFDKLLPGLPNPHYYIDRKDKSYYHAMCVLANNVSTLLWQKFYVEMENRFGIAATDLKPFLERTLINVKQSKGAAMSGPIARGDVDTLKKILTL